MKKKTKTISALASFFLPLSLLAAGLTNPIKSNSFEELLNNIIGNIILPLGIPIVALMIIYTGFMFISARGDKSKLEEAKKALSGTLIGAAIVLGAYAITAVIKATVGAL